MDGQTTRYALLRDRRTWDGVTIAGLQLERDGVLTLARVPGPADEQPIMLPGPFEVAPSGIVAGPCGDLYIADTASHHVIGEDGICKSRVVLPGSGGTGDGPDQFHAPRGLLLGPAGLYVADSGNGRVQVFRLPALGLRDIWEGRLQEPTGLATDSQGRVYVLDRGLKRVLRFSAWGAPDGAYNTAMSRQPDLPSPAFLTIDGKDTLYITDDQSNNVLRFDQAGQALGALPKVPGESPSQPRALVARGDRLYIADAADGQVWVYDGVANAYLGTLAGYRGPVAAMAVDEEGALLIKPGPGEALHHLPADRAYVQSGRLMTSGPLDAGADTAWYRVHVQADVPAGTAVILQTFVSDDRTATPTETDWSEVAALDMLLERLPAAGDGQPPLNRYLWLRVLLKSDSQRASPRLMQVQAETSGENYLNYLPAIYRREDALRGFLERWLALFRYELGAVELALEDMARRFDPATAPEDHLPWLATWLAFEPPAGCDAEELRRLLLRIYELYDRRGTSVGIREFVQLYTGVRPHLFEAFRERRVWQLGYTSALGFDTALAPFAPDGMIVPGLTLADPKYMGLRGEYYSGMNFEQLKLTPTDPDPTVDFDWKDKSPDPLIPADKFSVRWTGQVQPRYSETYTFSTSSDDGVRLWVDGRLLIDQWHDQQQTEHSGSMMLAAGRWYAIQLEYYEHTGGATIRLFWSSRSQIREIIPQSRLYSVRDEGARLEPPSPAELLVVGQAVVGQSGPLAASEFGMPLFSETAHLFTVMVPAAQLSEPARREALRRMVEAEKPAHTDFHLCFVEPRMRVGFQARIGVDSIVAGPREPMTLGGAWLDLDSVLGETDGERIGRVGQIARVGRDTVIG